VIGDSMVVGFEVPPEKVYTRVAENILREAGYDVEVINGGCRGYGTDQAYLFLVDEGLKYHPDLVLYQWVGNDFDDNRTIHRPHRMFGKAAFHLRDNGELELIGAPVPAEYPYAIHKVINGEGKIVELPLTIGQRFKLWLRDTVVTRSSFATTLVAVATGFDSLSQMIKSAGRFQAPPAPRSNKSWLDDTTAAILAAMREEAGKAGADFRFIGNIKEQQRRMAEEAGVQILGEFPEFVEMTNATDEPTRVPFDGHPNELGHALYGKAVADQILRQGLLEPRQTPILETGAEPAPVQDAGLVTGP
jgi:lysophospholipase L1-like esterase